MNFFTQAFIGLKIYILMETTVEKTTKLQKIAKKIPRFKYNDEGLK